jgi:hypothetical protein
VRLRRRQNGAKEVVLTPPVGVTNTIGCINLLVSVEYSDRANQGEPGRTEKGWRR